MRFRTLVALLFAVAAQSQAQTTQSLIINADQGKDTINRHIYGHFAEHLGRGIYDGIWSKTADGSWQIRDGRRAGIARDQDSERALAGWLFRRLLPLEGRHRAQGGAAGHS